MVVRSLLLLVAAYAAAVIDTSLGDLMRIGCIAPDLLTLTAIVWLLTTEGRTALVGAGIVALFGDLIAPGKPGLGAACMLLVGYAVMRARIALPSNHLAVQLISVLIATTAWALATAVLGRLVGQITLAWADIPGRCFGVALYTTGISVPVLMIAGWIREPLIARKRKLAE